MAWNSLLDLIQKVLWVTAVWPVWLLSASADPVNLPNEICKLREALVTVDSMSYKYDPLIVSLSRCSGASGKLPPSIKECIAVTSSTVALNAYNTITYQNETLLLQNDTSCGGQCVYDASVCDPVSQVWDSDLCMCKCKRDVHAHGCPPNYVWDPNMCSCICSAYCNDRQELNATACTCECFSKYYRRCSRKGKILHEDDCRCYNAAGSYVGLQGECNSLPTKWAAVVILVSMISFCVLAFDCFLLTKKTGLIYTMTLCCKSKDERISQTCDNSSLVEGLHGANDRHPLIQRTINT